MLRVNNEDLLSVKLLFRLHDVRMQTHHVGTLKISDSIRWGTGSTEQAEAALRRNERKRQKEEDRRRLIGRRGGVNLFMSVCSCQNDRCDPEGGVTFLP